MSSGNTKKDNDDDFPLFTAVQRGKKEDENLLLLKQAKVIVPKHGHRKRTASATCDSAPGTRIKKAAGEEAAAYLLTGRLVT